MAVIRQVVNNKYAIYSGDSAESVRSIPDQSVGLRFTRRRSRARRRLPLRLFDPAFATLSNARTYDEFSSITNTSSQRTLRADRHAGTHIGGSPWTFLLKVRTSAVLRLSGDVIKLPP